MTGVQTCALPIFGIEYSIDTNLSPQSSLKTLDKSIGADLSRSDELARLTCAVGSRPSQIPARNLELKGFRVGTSPLYRGTCSIGKFRLKSLDRFDRDLPFDRGIYSIGSDYTKNVYFEIFGFLGEGEPTRSATFRSPNFSIST